MLRCLIVAMFLFGMLGCKGVQPSDVTGTWVMTEQSRKALPPEFQKAMGKIVVNTDGTFTASELPEGLHPVPPYDMKLRMRLDSGTGVWKLAPWEGAQHVQLVFHNLVGTNEPNPNSYGFPLTVSRGWSSVILDYALGDPDDGNRVQFERK